VKEILDSTPDSTEQVTIEPDGRWFTGLKSDSTPAKPAQNHTPAGGDSDDDIVEIADTRPMIKREISDRFSGSFLATHTPPVSSRASTSTPLGSGPRTGSKRTSEIIDLTLDSDEEEPPRPVKRVAYTASGGPLISNSVNGVRPPSYNMGINGNSSNQLSNPQYTFNQIHMPLARNAPGSNMPSGHSSPVFGRSSTSSSGGYPYSYGGNNNSNSSSVTRYDGGPR
jgi:hypothetical protein